MAIVNLQRLIDSAHELKEKGTPARKHLGCSLLGHHCDRFLWLVYRWAFSDAEEFTPSEKFASRGQLLRLFRRGQLEEDRIIEDLAMIGIEVTHAQKRVSFGHGVAGSIDGIAIYQGERVLIEFKTSGTAKFRELKKAGVKKAQFQHFVQMQLYMHALKLDRALYCSVCKETDEYHFELVELEAGSGEAFAQRGIAITKSDRLPEPGPNCSASWYKCKFCPAYKICWQEKASTQVNCRTCAHSTSRGEVFTCEKTGGAAIDPCRGHVMHPDLAGPWQIQAGDDPWTATFANTQTGEIVTNGQDGSASVDLWGVKTDEA